MRRDLVYISSRAKGTGFVQEAIARMAVAFGTHGDAVFTGAKRVFDGSGGDCQGVGGVPKEQGVHCLRCGGFRKEAT